MAAVARGNIQIGGSNMYIMCGMYPMLDEHRLSASPLIGSPRGCFVRPGCYPNTAGGLRTGFGGWASIHKLCRIEISRYTPVAAKTCFTTGISLGPVNLTTYSNYHTFNCQLIQSTFSILFYVTVRLGIRCRYWVLSHTYNYTILYSIEAAYIYIHTMYIIVYL